jgi:hypothetical protein
MMIAFLTFTLMGYFGSNAGLSEFYNYAEAMKSGSVPYEDFTFGFLPLAMIFITIPSMFTSDPGTYSLIFGTEAILFITLTLYCAIKLAERLGVNKLSVSLILMLFVMLCFNNILTRLDIFVTAFIMLALYLFLSDGRRHTLGYAVMTVAALIMIYPAIFLLMMAIIDIRKKPHGPSTLLKGASACGIIAIVSIMPLIIMSVPIGDILSHVWFHGDSGTQIGTAVAALAGDIAPLGATAEHISVGYTSDTIGRICGILLPYWTYVCLAVFISVLAIMWYRIKPISEVMDPARIVIVFSAILLLAFVLLDKVHSTQYVVWPYMFLPFLMILGKNRMNRVMAILTASLIVLSVVIPAFSHYDNLFPVINLLRDVVFVCVFVNLLLFILGKNGAMCFTESVNTNESDVMEVFVNPVTSTKFEALAADDTSDQSTCCSTERVL